MDRGAAIDKLQSERTALAKRCQELETGRKELQKELQNKKLEVEQLTVEVKNLQEKCAESQKETEQVRT